MKCGIVILLIYCAESLAQGTKKGYDEDRWIWGFVDEPGKNLNNSQSLQSTTEASAYDPCVLYDPPKPSFKAPGRRINEEKCDEYIYDIKLVEERIKRKTECDAIIFKDKRPLAVGGQSAEPGQIPHMGAIGWKAVLGGYIFKCGSTLISPKFMMTAAHCIRAPPDTRIEDLEPKIIRLTDLVLYKNPDTDYNLLSTDINISKIIVHPQYKPPKKYYDIALMELANKVIYTNIMKPACLWNRADNGDFGKEVSLAGWGVLAQGSTRMSQDLQVADVDIIGSKQCDALLESTHNRHWMGLMENQLCAGRLEGGVDACQGDSGGPLQFRRPLISSSEGNIYYVIGVTSFGIGCALPNSPGIYTRVSSFIEWIEGHVWK